MTTEMTRDDALALIAGATTLRELRTTCRAITAQQDEDGSQILDGNDWAELPTFGGTTPTDTEAIWSWDATHLLVWDETSWTIVPRPAVGE